MQEFDAAGECDKVEVVQDVRRAKDDDLVTISMSPWKGKSTLVLLRYEDGAWSEPLVKVINTERDVKAAFWVLDGSLLVVQREEAIVFDSSFIALKMINFKQLNIVEFDVYCSAFIPCFDGDKFIASFWSYNRFDKTISDHFFEADCNPKSHTWVAKFAFGFAVEHDHDHEDHKHEHNHHKVPA